MDPQARRSMWGVIKSEKAGSRNLAMRSPAKRVVPCRPLADPDNALDGGGGCTLHAHWHYGQWWVTRATEWPLFQL